MFEFYKSLVLRIAGYLYKIAQALDLINEKLLLDIFKRPFSLMTKHRSDIPA